MNDRQQIVQLILEDDVKRIIPLTRITKSIVPFPDRARHLR